MKLIYLSLGSNKNNPEKQIICALKKIKNNLPQSKLINYSSLYISQPINCIKQPAFLNAAAKLYTKLDPECILEYLKKIEIEQGRYIIHKKCIPRSIDIDIMLYDKIIIQNKKIFIPHKELKKRLFMLLPLSEIEKNIFFPDNSNIFELIKLNMQQSLTIYKKKKFIII